MDEEKKAEATGAEPEPERLGSYQLQEQMEPSARGQGELYLATHEPSGATALVLKLAAEESAAPLKDWRVLLSASASLGCIVMQVVHTPWSRAPGRQSGESLVFTFEAVLDGVRRMARVVSDTDEPRLLRWHLGLGVASAAAVCALLFVLVRLAPQSQPPSGPDPLVSAAPGPMSHEVPTAAWESEPFFNAGLADTTPPGQPVLARPLPKEPFKGQKRPPCTRYTEVELVGGCWAPHELKAPCPETLFEYQGKCYLPMFSAKPPPQSLGQ